MPRPPRRAAGAARPRFESFTPGRRPSSPSRSSALRPRRVLLRQLGRPRPTYAPLFSNLASADAERDRRRAQRRRRRLPAGRRRADDHGAQDQVYDLRLTMSGKGLPAGSDTGYALLDQQGITTSEFHAAGHLPAGPGGRAGQDPRGDRRRQGRRRAPRDARRRTSSPTTRASRPRRCCVDTRHRHAAVRRAGPGVVHLVSSSVEGLDPTEVTVADADGKVLSAAGGGAAVAAGDARPEAEQRRTRTGSTAALQKHARHASSARATPWSP